MSYRFWFMPVLLLAATVGLYRLPHGEAVPLRQHLSTVPMQIGQWQGTDFELPKRIVDAAGVDEYLNRVYTVPSSSLHLYVGYYKSQRTGETIHSPKNCLPGAGWQPVVSSHTELRTQDGRMLPVNYYIIQKGLERQLVLYWYQSHGRIFGYHLVPLVI